MKRYFLGTDCNGDKYVVEWDHWHDWVKWNERGMDEEDPSSWEAPEYAKRVDGEVTFTDPQCSKW